MSDERNKQVRKLAETYRPNISDLADRLAKGPLADLFSNPRPRADPTYDIYNSHVLAQDAIRKAMRK